MGEVFDTMKRIGKIRKERRRRIGKIKPLRLEYGIKGKDKGK
ncbi:MAG: hypothetical protein ACXQTS_01030 [Candidatus Methanospirareceae archaeon]